MPDELRVFVGEHKRKIAGLKAALERDLADPAKVRDATPHDYVSFLRCFKAGGGKIVCEDSDTFLAQAFRFVLVPLTIPPLPEAEALNLIVPPRVAVSFPAGMGESRVYKMHADGSARAQGGEGGEAVLYADVRPYFKRGLRRFVPDGFAL